MDEPRLKRAKPNSEEERFTELSSRKMLLITRHQYLQVESLKGEIEMCGEELIGRVEKKFKNEFDHKDKFFYDYRPVAIGMHGVSL